MSDTKEKTYLKWYNKVGYGSGDIAGNVVYAFLSTFIMFYLSDTVGLNTGIAGTLIMVSKLFDGVTDLFFGSMIDKTHTKMGKARPWMFGAYFGCAVTLVAVFAIPTSLGEFAKYAWFFIAYTLLNGVFYTANNIAYSALTSLITKNAKERVQMGSFRFIFAFATSLLIQSVTIQAVAMMGGGAAGWRNVAVVYAIIGLIVNSLSCFSVRELSEEELNETDGTEEENAEPEEKYGIVEAAKLLFTNKYFLMICGVYLLTQFYSAMFNQGIYFMKYVLGDENLLATFSWAVNIPLIISLVFTPYLVEKLKGMYKVNVLAYIMATIGRVLVLIAGYMANVPLMLAFSAFAALGMAPLQGSLNALIAETSEYTYLTKGKRINGTMYSCTSFGVKVGGGIGTAVAGWLLAFSGYDSSLAVQSASCMNMIHIIYLWLPVVFNVLIVLVLSRLTVEKANQKLRAKG